MSALTNTFSFFQSLDRSLVSLGYSAEIATADLLGGDSLYLIIEVTGSINNDSEEYATAELRFSDKQTMALFESLSDADRETFAFDTAVIDWPHYFIEVHCPAVTAPVRRRRPAPGAYGPDYHGPRPPGIPDVPAEE